MDGCPATASRAFRRDPPNGYILPAPAPAASRVPRRDGGTDEGPARTPLGTPRGPRVALDRARARLGRDSRARTARVASERRRLPRSRRRDARAMSHPSADARAPLRPLRVRAARDEPTAPPAPLPATPPRLDQDSARARRSMLGHWIAHTTGHHLDARSDEVRAFSAIPWRVAEITLEKNTKKIFPSRVAFRARARRSTPSPLTHAPTAHPRRPPTRPFSRSGFLRGSLGRRRPVQAPERARAGIVARALRADDPSLPDVSPDKFLHAHNYKQFVAGAERLGVADRHLFLLHDLGGINGDQANVLACLAAVKEIADARARRAKPPRQPQQQPQHPASAAESADARVSRVFQPMLADGDDAETPGAAAHSSDGTPMASSATPRRAPQRRATTDPRRRPPPIPGLCFESLKRGGDKPSPRGARGDDAPKVPRKEEREQGVERNGAAREAKAARTRARARRRRRPHPRRRPPNPPPRPRPAAAAVLSVRVRRRVTRGGGRGGGGARATPEPPADSDDSDDSNSEEDGFPGFRLAREPAREPLGGGLLLLRRRRERERERVRGVAANALEPGGPERSLFRRSRRFDVAARGASRRRGARVRVGQNHEGVRASPSREGVRARAASRGRRGRVPARGPRRRRARRVCGARESRAYERREGIRTRRPTRLDASRVRGGSRAARRVARGGGGAAARRRPIRAASKNAAADAETRAALMASKTQAAETEANRARMQLEDAKVSLAELAATLEDAEAEKDAAKKEAETVQREAEAVAREPSRERATRCAPRRRRETERLGSTREPPRDESGAHEGRQEPPRGFREGSRGRLEGGRGTPRVDARHSRGGGGARRPRESVRPRVRREQAPAQRDPGPQGVHPRLLPRPPGVASVDERRGLAGSEASLEASALEASALSSSSRRARAIERGRRPGSRRARRRAQTDLQGGPRCCTGLFFFLGKGRKRRGAWGVRHAFVHARPRVRPRGDAAGRVRGMFGARAVRVRRGTRRARFSRQRADGQREDVHDVNRLRELRDPPAFEPPRERVPRTRRPHRRRELPRVGRSVFSRARRVRRLVRRTRPPIAVLEIYNERCRDHSPRPPTRRWR